MSEVINGSRPSRDHNSTRSGSQASSPITTTGQLVPGPEVDRSCSPIAVIRLWSAALSAQTSQRPCPSAHAERVAWADQYIAKAQKPRSTDSHRPRARASGFMVAITAVHGPAHEIGEPMHLVLGQLPRGRVAGAARVADHL